MLIVKTQIYHVLRAVRIYGDVVYFPSYRLPGPVICVSEWWGSKNTDIVKKFHAHIIDAFLTNLTEFRYEVEIQNGKFDLRFPHTRKESDIKEKANTIVSAPNANRLNAIGMATVYGS